MKKQHTGTLPAIGPFAAAAAEAARNKAKAERRKARAAKAAHVMLALASTYTIHGF